MKNFKSEGLKKAAIFMLVLLLLPVNTFFTPVPAKAETMDSAPLFLSFNRLSAAQKAIYCAVFIDMMNPDSDSVYVDLSTFNLSVGDVSAPNFFKEAIFGVQSDFPRYSWFNSYSMSYSYGSKVNSVTISIPHSRYW